MKNILMTTVVLLMLTAMPAFAFETSHENVSTSSLDRDIACLKSWGFKRVPMKEGHIHIPALGTYAVTGKPGNRHLYYNYSYDRRVTKCENGGR